MDATQQALVAAGGDDDGDADTDAVGAQQQNAGTVELKAEAEAAAAPAGQKGAKKKEDNAERWRRTRGHPLYPQLLSTLAENSLEGLPPAIAALRQPRVMESPLSPKSAVRHVPRFFLRPSSAFFALFFFVLLTFARALDRQTSISPTPWTTS